MPETFKRFTMAQDGRRRLLPKHYPAVRKLYLKLKSQRAVAKYFGVSKRLIQFILRPELLIALKERQRKEQHWKKYFNRRKHAIAIRKWRWKKKALGLKIKIKKCRRLIRFNIKHFERGV